MSDAQLRQAGIDLGHIIRKMMTTTYVDTHEIVEDAAPVISEMVGTLMNGAIPQSDLDDATKQAIAIVPGILALADPHNKILDSLN